MLSEFQRNTIASQLQGKYLLFFVIWAGVFFWINFYFNELWVIGLSIFNYKLSFSVPYIFFIVSNSLLIWLSMNLLIHRCKEMHSMNPGGGILSIFGTFFTFLTWACPWCVAWIFPIVMWIFGSNMTLYSLPFNWLELQALSFVFLLFWIYFLSKGMNCEIAVKK